MANHDNPGVPALDCSFSGWDNAVSRTLITMRAMGPITTRRRFGSASTEVAVARVRSHRHCGYPVRARERHSVEIATAAGEPLFPLPWPTQPWFRPSFASRFLTAGARSRTLDPPRWTRACGWRCTIFRSSGPGKFMPGRWYGRAGNLRFCRPGHRRPRRVDLVEVDASGRRRQAQRQVANLGLNFVQPGLDHLQAGFNAYDAERHEQKRKRVKQRRQKKHQWHPPRRPVWQGKWKSHGLTLAPVVCEWVDF